ncbi:hypothetical protein PP178_10255 [Zeaxanthinibacter sp. PT1]|uniref:hypothetical protein n=1 Tax=Zeaxanthinibacter TaxID=561554 RepID=UPI00234C0037|nr:hypothetical protein [Zeaxanthinibacter sp. PT1]MDC6351936.1 hypothetical protein [Zeaxanthinibacter sp. PT1]
MESYSSPALSTKLDHLTQESRTWITKIRFTEDELSFIDQLLHSDVFEPNTPNLFERLSEYGQRLEQIWNTKEDLKKLIDIHMQELAELIKSTHQLAKDSSVPGHEQLQAQVEKYLTLYGELKSEIFNYAGGILKKRKA